MTRKIKKFLITCSFLSLMPIASKVSASLSIIENDDDIRLSLGSGFSQAISEKSLKRASGFKLSDKGDLTGSDNIGRREFYMTADGNCALYSMGTTHTEARRLFLAHANNPEVRRLAHREIVDQFHHLPCQMTVKQDYIDLKAKLDRTTNLLRELGDRIDENFRRDITGQQDQIWDEVGRYAQTENAYKDYVTHQLVNGHYMRFREDVGGHTATYFIDALAYILNKNLTIWTQVGPVNASGERQKIEDRPNVINQNNNRLMVAHRFVKLGANGTLELIHRGNHFNRLVSVNNANALAQAVRDEQASVEQSAQTLKQAWVAQIRGGKKIYNQGETFSTQELVAFALADQKLRPLYEDFANGLVRGGDIDSPYFKVIENKIKEGEEEKVVKGVGYKKEFFKYILERLGYVIDPRNPSVNILSAESQRELAEVKRRAEEARKETVDQLKALKAAMPAKPKSASPQAKVKDVLPGNENEREGYVRGYYNAPDGLLAVARAYMTEQGKPLSSNWKDYDTLKKAAQARHPKLFPDKFFNPVEMLASLISKSHAEEIMKRMKRSFKPSEIEKEASPAISPEREGYVRGYYNADDGLLATARAYMTEQGKPLSSNWKDYDTLKKAVQARHPKLFPDKFFNPVEMLASLISKSYAEEIMKRMKHRPFNPPAIEKEASPAISPERERRVRKY